MNTKAIKIVAKLQKLAKEQGKDMSDFENKMHCPLCGQEGWGIEGLTYCHRCVTLMVYDKEVKQNGR